jgi:UrcA family protein
VHETLNVLAIQSQRGVRYSAQRLRIGKPKHKSGGTDVGSKQFKERNMKTSIAMLVLLVAASVGAPAMATISTKPNAEQAHQVRVRYGDLNLNTEQGADELYRRISYAAHEVCSDVVVPSYVLLESAYRQCRQTAMQDAVAKVDRPRLTALYDRHFPENPLANNNQPHGSRSVG